MNWQPDTRYFTVKSTDFFYNVGKKCSFDLPCVSFANVSQFVRASFQFGFEGGVWGLIVLIPDE